MKRYTTTVKKQQPTNIDFIILSAAAPNRAKTYGNRSTWCLKNKPLIIHQIENILECYNNANIILVVGFEAEKIINLVQKYKIVIIENQLFEQQGQIGSLKLGLLASKNNHVVIIHGDIYFDKTTIQSVVKSKSTILIDSLSRLDEHKVGVRGIEYVENIGYNWKTKWAEICYLTDLELKLIKEYTLDSKNNKFLTYEGLEYIINNNGKLYLTEPENTTFKEINNMKDIT